MNLNKHHNLMERRSLLVAAGSAVVLTACSTTSGSPEARRKQIDTAADTVLARLYQKNPEAQTIISKSRGLLIFPSIISAGLGVGASYGEGVLREANRPIGYFSITEGAFGLVAGAEKRAYFLAFLTQEALDKFRNSSGWTAGADAAVTMIDQGAGVGVDTQSGRNSVVGYALSLSGLMANVKIDGAKISKLGF